MLISLFKHLITLLTVIFILSIELHSKTIFQHIYGVISPLTRQTQEHAKKIWKNAFHTTQVYSKKFFHNSEPRNKDSISSKLSAREKVLPEEIEFIKEEERNELNKLINNH